jgi:protein TonB
MTGGFYQQRRLSPSAIAVVVLLHGAALAALMMAKMEMPLKRDPPIIAYPVPITPPPPPHPAPKTPKPASEPLDRSPPLAPPPDSNPPMPPPRPFSGPPPSAGAGAEGPVAPPTPPPPPPPPPRIFEPARARADLGSYISDGDYPASAIRNEEQGTTRFLLQVSAEGRVTGCTVTRSSGSSALDSTACRLMRARARFTPARDSSGNPTTDSVANAIHWVLPAG